MRIRGIIAPNPGPLTLDGTQTWLVGESTVIDPGPDIASHIDAIASAMPRLTTILITHRHADHAPAAIPLAGKTGATIAAPPGVLDSAYAVRRLTDGETVATDDGELEVIATPGHTNEHVSFLSEAGDLFTGDTILGRGTTAIFPPDGHMARYLESLRRLRAREPKTIYPAHGPVRTDALALIDEYIAHRLEREQQIAEAIEAGAATVTAIRERVYPDVDPRLAAAAEVQITAHVIKLVEEGRVSRLVAGFRF